MRGKPLHLVLLENGCIVDSAHCLNQDGYLRIKDERYKGKGRAPLIMAHRLIWEECGGVIPKGYELHHTCHNRACVNINHLELVNISEHKVQHNSTRYRARYESARAYWEEHRCSGTELGKQFGVASSTGCKWIRQWKRRD